MPSKKVTRQKASETQPQTEKFSETRAALTRLQAEREKILAKSAPHRERREKLLAKIQPLEAELREANQAVKDAHGERLFNLDNEIGALARAMGARSLSPATTES